MNCGRRAVQVFIAQNFLSALTCSLSWKCWVNSIIDAAGQNLSEASHLRAWRSTDS
jgi:hypothetical protein